MRKGIRRLAMKTVLLFVVQPLCFAVNVQAASFDCAKASTKVEKIICDNPEISQLDDELSASYKTALQDEKHAESIRQAQKQWMRERNGCADADCVKRAYEMRLSSLTIKQATIDDGTVTKQKVASSTQGGSWTYRGGAGRDEPLCRELLKRLNRYAHDGGCSLPVMMSYHKFTAPPWEELDPQQHEELLFKLEKYAQEGPDGYFHLLPGLEALQPDWVYRNRAKQFLEEGGRLRVWRTRLVNHYGSGPIVAAPPGNQTIVQKYIRISKEIQSTYCTDRPKPTELYMRASIYIVTSDLSGPDPNVDPGTFGIMGGSDLVIYEGKPLLIRSEDVWWDGELRLECPCDFEFVKGEK